MQGAFFMRINNKGGKPMTIIKLVTNDQQLTVSQKPKLASGDVESVKVQVEFDVFWDDFIAKSAVFHTAKHMTVYEALLTNNECTIPHEVLAEPGTLFIGIRGIASDGGAVKTSTLVKYTITQGAEAGESTAEPTPDMYQQYLQAMDEKLDPHLENYRKYLNAKLEQQNRQVEAIIDEFSSDTIGTIERHNSEIGRLFASHKIMVCSREGDGVSGGVNNPTVLEFQEKPLCIILEYAGGIILRFRGRNITSGSTLCIVWGEDNTITLWDGYNSAPGNQLNYSGTNYYIAILEQERGEAE